MSGKVTSLEAQEVAAEIQTLFYIIYSESYKSSTQYGFVEAVVMVNLEKYKLRLFYRDSARPPLA